MNEKFANKFSFNYQPQIDVSTSFPHIDTFSIGLLITFENFVPQIHSCEKMKFSLSQINIEIISRIANCEKKR